jgi:hypothetical protein
VKHRSAVVAFGVVLVAVIAAAGVSAATPVTTSVTILNINGERITGRVTSPKKACMKGRKITLYLRSASVRRNYGYPGYQTAGRATSRSNGTWEVKPSSETFLEGDYRAFVASKRVTTGGETLLCKSRWGSTKHG